MGEESTVTEDKPILVTLRERRKTLLDEMGTAIEGREKERADFEARTDATDEDRSAHVVEESAFGAAHEQRKAELKALDQRVDEEELQERRRGEAAKASTLEAQVTREPLTYERENGHSYFRDMAVDQAKGFAARVSDPGSAIERLQNHANEMRVEMPKIEAERRRKAMSEVDSAERRFTGSFVEGVRKRGLERDPFLSVPASQEQRVNPNRLQGEGGYFVPPLWLPEFIPALRAGRVAAGLCRQMPLPEGTDSINMPKIKTPTLVAPQTADNAPVASQDWEDEAVQANVKTLAGQSDVSIQLLEQSPYHLDQVIMEDLLADYNRLVGRQVIYAPGTSASSLNAGQIKGLYPFSQWSGNEVTWTSSNPYPTSFNQVMGAMASRIATNRFSVQDVHFLLHPRRWYWFGTAPDGLEGKAGRPLVAADGFGPYNAQALYVPGEEPAEGKVGRVPFGPHDIYVDANVPTNDNGSGVRSGTYDVAIANKWDDAWLFEGALRTRAMSEVLSGTLEIRFQCFNYIAFLQRYGQSLAGAMGTGFAAPTGSIDTSITF
jgi:HK97 family phage major capsid protein